MVLELPPKQFWLELWESARGEIIGGLVVAILLFLVAIFWKTLLSGLRRLVHDTSAPTPPPPRPQEVVLRLENSQAPMSAPVEAPPSPAMPRSHIPRPPLAGFVARRDESGREIVERLKSELSPEKEQLLVLWGPGGVGKTTLAAETARATRDLFPGGIAWITADGRPDFGLSTLLDEIASHLGRPDLRQLAPDLKSDQISHALSTGQPTLVVLDNFETIAVAEQKVCAEWLAKRASCPALITSRDEVAHARPVQIFAMSIPEAQEFLQRLISEARNPRVFELLDHDHIIAAADRNPLVLQWLVKQIDSARQPNAVLDDLSHGKGDAASRVFDRSFDLEQVTDDGRATLLALSLFVPSASRSALAEVAGFGTDTERLDHAVQQLSELWLIDTTERNERVKVQGLTRELAKARLAQDHRINDYKRRFINNFLQYTLANVTNEGENLEALEAEKDNILGAMDLAFELEEWKSVKIFAYAIGVPVGGWLGIRGYWTDVLRANKQALEAARHTDSPADVLAFAHNLAIQHGEFGNHEAAQTLYNEALALGTKLGDDVAVATVLHQLANLAFDKGELNEARALYNKSLELSRKMNKPHGIAKTLHQLGILAKDDGNISEARKLHTESLEILRNERIQHPTDNGIHDDIAISLQQLGVLAHREKKFSAARQLYNESFEISQSLGHQNRIALALCNLAILADDEGDKTSAIKNFQKALEIFERLNSPTAHRVREDLKKLTGK